MNTQSSGVGSRATAYRTLTDAFLSCSMSCTKQLEVSYSVPCLVHDTVQDRKARKAAFQRIDALAPRLLQLSTTFMAYAFMIGTMLNGLVLLLAHDMVLHTCSIYAAACSDRADEFKNIRQQAHKVCSSMLNYLISASNLLSWTFLSLSCTNTIICSLVQT